MDDPRRPQGRNRFAVALDVDDLDSARRLMAAVGPWFGVAKIGLELYSAAGPAAVRALVDDGWVVFADIKLHDIPTTVERAARVLGGLGVTYLNFHATGGEAMLRAGVTGLVDGAASAGGAQPVPIAVTVLTSDADAPADLVAHRVTIAEAAGCEGVVCAASDIAVVRQAAPGFVTIVPGIRTEGSERNDQARAATPEAALAAGASLLVVGRTVTSAADPAAAAAALVAGVGERASG